MEARSRRTPPAIPGYRIERPLGDGGMATAWLALQLSLGREVALKVLDPLLAADAAFVERFVREARVLASLRHRHIVAIHDVGVADGLPYLAMEFLHHGSILPLCGHCDAATALRCVREIADALGHAHARGIVHRDVKPENILRGEDGGFVLGDFGIARVADASALAAPTAPGLSFGTPAYMAPERWSAAPVDGRSDFYSLGCVLHALLTGRTPYQASEEIALGHQHLAEPIPLLPAAFAALQGLLARLLAKDPADRHPDAAAIVTHVQALEQQLAPDSALASGQTVLLNEWPFGSGQHLLTPAAAPTPFPASPPTSPARLWAWGLGALAALGLLVGAWTRRGDPDGTPPPAPKPPVVAVLPLLVDDNDPELARMAVVLAEDLTTRLARLPGLEVVARTSAVAVAQEKLDAAAMATRLGAGLLVEGSMRREANAAIAINLRVIEGRSGTQRGSAQVQASADRLWQAENQIVEQLAARLLPRGTPTQASVYSSRSRDANAALFRGRALLSSASAPADLEGARKAFAEALAIDPAFAPAQAAVCRAGLKAFMQARNPAEFHAAKLACDQAAALDPDGAEVVVSLGDLHRVNGDHARAIEYYQRVIDDPAVRGDALAGLAKSQAALGRSDEAERNFRHAQALLPGYWGVYLDTGVFYLGLARYADAADAFRAALALGGDRDPRVHNNLGSALFMGDHLEEAETAYSRALQLKPTHSVVSNLGTVRFILGNPLGAAELYREALRIEPNDYRMYGNLADALGSAGGDPAEVRALYARAAEGASAFLEAQPDSVDAASELAWYWVNCGRTDAARPLLEGIAARDIDDGAIPYRIAGAWLRLGDAAAARAQLDRAIELGYSARIIAGTPWLKPLIAREATAPAR